MKKREKKILAAGMAAVLAAMFIPGCAKQATPENLLKDMTANLEAEKSMVYNLNLTAQMSAGGSEIGMNVNLDMETVKDPEAVHGTGRIEMNMPGTDIGTDVEMYTVPDEESFFTYIRTGDEWVKSFSGAAEGAAETRTFSDIQAQASVFELSGDFSDVNGQECYELKGNIGGETIKDLLDDDMLSSLSGFAIDDKFLEKAEIPCTLDIYREGILPARLRIDMKDLADAVTDSGGMEMEISEYDLEITFLEYGSVREIEVPQEALDAPETGSADIFSGDGEAGAPGKPQRTEPAEQLEEPGTGWESYTVQINSRVITLPCTISDLEGAGLSLDTSYTPADSMVADYGTAWFRDENGNEIMADLLPAGEEPQKVRDCLIGGITVSTYDTQKGGLDVVFPGGIRTGSLAEDVLAVYGGTEDFYEGQFVDIYSWYEPESYYNGFSMDVDPETGMVTEIRMTRYE